LSDYGHPTIKEKVLDLLTQIEKESQKVMGVNSPGGTNNPDGSPKKAVGKKPSLLSNGVA
jgi:hypothetical protein